MTSLATSSTALAAGLLFVGSALTSSPVAAEGPEPSASRASEGQAEAADPWGTGSLSLLELRKMDVGEGGFRCPGDDPGFWMDLKESGWVGYQETWDLETCSQGAAIYAPGTSRGWEEMRPRRASAYRRPPILSDDEVRYYTTVLPYVAFGTLGVVFLLAWLMALLSRLRPEAIYDVACPSCAVQVPLTELEAGTFCPKCGAGVPLADAGGNLPQRRDPGRWWHRLFGTSSAGRGRR